MFLGLGYAQTPQKVYETKEAGDKLFNLFAGHYSAIKDYLNAKSDKEKQSANPNLPKDAVLSLLKTHGGHHIAQIDAVKAGDFEREAQIWEAMVKHIYTISDAIVDAIAKQFPNKMIEGG